MVKQVKEATSTAIEFSKQLAHFVIAAAFIGLGVYAVYSGKHEISLAIKSILLIFAGALVLLFGLVELYKVLMRKEK